MAAFKWSQMSLFLVLMLQFTATAGQRLSFTVRLGHDVTLPCENVIIGQRNCDITDWLFRDLRSRGMIQLINSEQIGPDVGSKSDRLSVTSNCSLAIKNITDKDYGLYNCRQLKSRQKITDFFVLLSVVKITDYEEDETFTLTCSLLTYGCYRYRVEWMNTSSDMMTSSYQCSSNVTFTTSHVDQKSEFYKSLKCKVTDVVTEEEHLFSFSHQTTYEVSTKTTIRPTIQPTTTKTTIRPTIQPTTTKEINTSPGFPYLLRCIVVSLGLAALVISVVTVNIWTRIKGNQNQKEENTVHNDEDVGTVNYENIGEPSVSFQLR
ncbi:uncharacterized protein [Brachyistius frenatus]|uniref:uncharacterized protein n=1 Tax=Brachyistius frenatus TaxID=100188 RepID=UPI0037E736CD